MFLIVDILIYICIIRYSEYNKFVYLDVYVCEYVYMFVKYL